MPAPAAPATPAAPAAPAGRRSWRGVSVEERADTRRTLLLDAAFELLGTEGWSAVTVRGVCRTARLHPRYFYQAFDDLDALLVAVFDRLVDELRQAIAVAVSAETHGAERARAGLEVVARFVTDDRRRARVLYTEALGNERLRQRRVETMHQFVAALVPSGDHPAAEVGAYIRVGGFTNVLVAWLDGRVDVSLDELVDHATAILLAAGRAANRLAAGSKL
jgi:AcrR family transcriptional regulator